MRKILVTFVCMICMVSCEEPLIDESSVYTFDENGELPILSLDEFKVYESNHWRDEYCVKLKDHGHIYRIYLMGEHTTRRMSMAHDAECEMNDFKQLLNEYKVNNE